MDKSIVPTPSEMNIHRGTGHTSVHRATAYERRNNIAHAESEHLIIVLYAIIILHSKAVLCQKGFCHNDHSYSYTAAHTLNKRY